MEAPGKTMFEIYREGDYNRRFRAIFYTDLEEHERDREIARAASGETVFSGFIDDARKEAAKEAVEQLVAQLNELDETADAPTANDVEVRLDAFLVS